MGFIGPVGEAGLAGEKVRHLVPALNNYCETFKFSGIDSLNMSECCVFIFRGIEGRWAFPGHLEKRDRR